MIQYVVGFLFNQRLDAVALIEKQKPAWQKGFLNGVGGKVEPGEFPADAMVREFKEETGADVTGWMPVGCLTVRSEPTPGAEVCLIYFYTARGDFDLETTTNEEVIWLDSMSELTPVVPNLRWLIPLALMKWSHPDWKEGGTFALNV